MVLQEDYPKISVVMPCFNHVQFVEKAILSVLSQTYKNFELIVIDDGSTDGSVDLLEALSERLPFTLVTQENRGVCKTLNRAVIEFSTGDYVSLLASDDFWHETKLTKQMRCINDAHDSDFCFSLAKEFDSETERTIRIFPKKPLVGNVLNKVFIRQHVPAGSILFTRKLFDKLGGFDENLIEEDWDFVIRSAAVTNFCAVSEPLFFYRSHLNNTMKTTNRRVIFHQKAKLLSKNYLLVSPVVWLGAIILHFIYDHVVMRLRK